MSTPTEPLTTQTVANFPPENAPAHGHLDPDDPPWSVAGAVGVWVASVFIMVVMQVLFLVPYALQRDVPTDALNEFATTDPTAILVAVVSIFPAHLLTLGLAWLVVTRFRKHPFLEALGWRWDERFNFWRSVGLAIALLVVGGTIIWLTGNPETPLDRIINSSRFTALTIAFVATLTAPLVEEVVYRGLLYSALQRAVGVAWAVVIVVALFALVHVPQYITSVGVISTILMLSIFLTIIRAYTGKLLPCFIIHLVFNGIQSLLIVAAPYLKQFAPVTENEAVGAILALARFAHPLV